MTQELALCAIEIVSWALEPGGPTAGRAGADADWWSGNSNPSLVLPTRFPDLLPVLHPLVSLGRICWCFLLHVSYQLEANAGKPAEVGRIKEDQAY